jgi:hypothetical protein
MAAWTDQQRAAFLACLAETGNVSDAARWAAVSRSGAYALRLADEAFALAWTEALAEAADALELEARRRAVDGVEQPVLYAGKPAHDDGGAPITIRHYSDRLLELLLKARRPESFKPSDEAEDGPALDDDERVRRIMWIFEQARARRDRQLAEGHLGAAAGAAEDGL